MFQYEFMQIAFLVGILLSVTLSLIGSHVVFKRLSMTGDALSHTALAGVAIGLVMGANPLLWAVVTCIFFSLIIEFIRTKFSKYSELSIAVVLSLGVGLAGVLSSFAPMSNFSTYLFGSIVAITKGEMVFSIVIFLAVVSFFVLFYKELMFIAYNEASARIAKVPVRAINIAVSVLTAVTVAIASRTIGALIVTSLMVVPVAAAMQISKNYRATIINSVIISMLSVIVGLVLSYAFGVKPGGAIVLVSVMFLAICLLTKPKHAH